MKEHHSSYFLFLQTFAIEPYAVYNSIHVYELYATEFAISLHTSSMSLSNYICR